MGVPHAKEPSGTMQVNPSRRAMHHTYVPITTRETKDEKRKAMEEKRTRFEKEKEKGNKGKLLHW